MTKQVLIVGLGQFGMGLARALVDRGIEVLAADRKEEQVRAAAHFVTEAAAFDSTDEEALGRMLPATRDACVCAIGDESREGSIITTALLRQMGAIRLVARATDPIHARILRLVGAHEVVNPEAEFGRSLATRLLYSAVLGEVALGDGLALTEINTPPSFVGRTLVELQLPKRFSLTLVARRPPGTTSIQMPEPTRKLEPDETLFLIGPTGASARLLEEVS